MPGHEVSPSWDEDLASPANFGEIPFQILARRDTHRNMDPVTLIWTLPDAKDIMEVLLIAAINTHKGYMRKAASDVTTTMEKGDLITGLVIINPMSW